jgi:hypothetical protein
MTQAPLPPIRFGELAAALLANAESLLAKWLPGGRREGNEWKCGDLQGAPGRSCSVNIKTGVWSDFQSGETGADLLDLFAAIHGLSQQKGKAARQVAEEEGLEDVAGIVRGTAGARPSPAPRPVQTSAPPAKAAREEEGWRTVVPVPENAPRATFRHHHRSSDDIEHVAEYRVGDQLAGYVVRFRTSDGGKDPIPYTWCTSARDGGSRWHWKTWDEPRPLYFPGHELPNGRTVILVEGEKKADVLQQLLDAGAPGTYCVASWPGGCKAIKKSGWSILAGCTVLAWADCDAKREPLTQAERKANPDKAAQAVLQQAKPLLPPEKQPGMVAMLWIGAHLREEHGCTVQLLPIPQPLEVPDGWDCRDAIENDGWTFDQVQGFFARAYALPAGASADAAPPPAAPPPADGPASAPAGDDDGGRPWWLRPYWDAEKCRWLVSRKLVIAALTHDEDLAGVLALDGLSNNIVKRRPWPWGARAMGPVVGSDDLLLGKYLTDTYGLPSIPRAALSEAIETVAHSAHFHPVREYLEGLEWDGTSRIDKWLVYVIGEKPETLKPKVYEYLRLVGRYWLLGMVNRVMDPGCKFDYCPVLEGKGGLGKSTLVEVLATTPWYSDTHFDVGRGKEGQEQVQGLWLYEIAELQQFGKAEIQLIKAFISAKADRYRPSYGRVVETYKRQCVLVGTTNERNYLRDRTGNRRFWPVPVRHRINIPWLQKWRDQLLAEAFALFQAGERFHPTWEDEERLFVPMQEKRLVETAVHSELLHILTRSPTQDKWGQAVNELTEFVTISQLTQALGVDAAKSSPGLEQQIRGWLEHEGWEHERRSVGGGRPWGYVRPKDWPPAPKAEDGDDDEVGDKPKSEGPGPAQPGPANSGGADDDPF